MDKLITNLVFVLTGKGIVLAADVIPLERYKQVIKFKEFVDLSADLTDLWNIGLLKVDKVQKKLFQLTCMLELIPIKRTYINKNECSLKQLKELLNKGCVHYGSQFLVINKSDEYLPKNTS